MEWAAQHENRFIQSPGTYPRTSVQRIRATWVSGCATTASHTRAHTSARGAPHTRTTYNTRTTLIPRSLSLLYVFCSRSPSRRVVCNARICACMCACACVRARACTYLSVRARIRMPRIRLCAGMWVFYACKRRWKWRLGMQMQHHACHKTTSMLQIQDL